MTTPLNRVTILVAEDDDGHAELIQEHLREAGLSNPMVRFRDGQEALDFLRAERARGGDTRDSHFLLLLDIWMPKRDGLDVLRTIKADPFWHTMPVIVLTTTDDPREVESCYAHGCNCYLVKPLDYLKFAHILKQLGLFLMVVEVPGLRPTNGTGGPPT